MLNLVGGESNGFCHVHHRVVFSLMASTHCSDIVSVQMMMDSVNSQSGRCWSRPWSEDCFWTCWFCRSGVEPHLMWFIFHSFLKPILRDPAPQKTKLSVQVLHHFSTGALLPIWGLFESLYSLYSAARRSCVFADNQCNHRVLQKITVSQKSLFFFFYSAAVWTKVQSSAHCLRFTDTGWKQYRWFFSKNKILTQLSLPGSLWRFVLPPSLERTLQVGQW